MNYVTSSFEVIRLQPIFDAFWVKSQGEAGWLRPLDVLPEKGSQHRLDRSGAEETWTLKRGDLGAWRKNDEQNRSEMEKNGTKQTKSG